LQRVVARSSESVGSGGSDGRRLRPVLWEIAVGESQDLEVRSLLSCYPEARLALVTAGDDPFSETERQLLIEELANMQSADSAEEVLVQSVRNVSARQATIGPNCLSVRIERSKPLEPLIRFLPQEVPRALVGAATVEVGVSPWVIGPGGAVPPALLIGGGHRVQLGKFSVRLEGPERPPGGQGPPAMWSSRERPRIAGYVPDVYNTPRPWEQIGGRWPGLRNLTSVGNTRFGFYL
jgi:hypothetical protein